MTVDTDNIERFALDFYCGGGFTIPNLNLSRFLRNSGREEIIHHFQTTGHPYLHAKAPNPAKYTSSSEIRRLICNFEVEARTVTDQIALANNEEPLWKDFDEFLEKNYPKMYNKPL